MRYYVIIVLCVLLFSPIFASTNSVKLNCWIIGDDGGNTAFTYDGVSNLVNKVNEIYSQVVLTFVIDSISHTNNTYLSDLIYTNTAQKHAICNITNNTGGLELYFIRSLSGRPTAFCSLRGIVIGPNANARTVAHEIGHACGLPDIYNYYTGTSLAVYGSPSKDRMVDDWGWYPSSVSHSNSVERLLMYGIKSNVKADISYGDVFGLHYTNFWNRTTRKWERVWKLDNAPIGFGLHGNRNPQSR
jgi:hypothetical protein